MKTQALILMLLSTASANAALTLSKPPLFVQPPPAANIVFTFDDSGSMARGYTPNEVYQAGTSGLLPVTDGVDECAWRDFPHLYASDANGQYYNPLVTYVPPVYADGTPFPDSVFTNAYLDGFAAYRTKGTPVTTINKRNLALDYRASLVFGASLGNAGETSVRFAATPSTSCNGNGNTAWILEGARGLKGDLGALAGTGPLPTGAQLQRAFYFTYDGPRSGPGGKPTLMELYGHNGTRDAASALAKFNRIRYVASLVGTDAASEKNFANWYTYYRTRNLMGRTAATVAFSQLPPNIRVAWQGLNGTTIAPTNTVIARFGPASPTVSTQRTNFFKFINEILAPSGTPTRAATNRVRQFFDQTNTNTTNTKNPYYDLELSTATTPNVPTIVSCRQNYHMLFTDGGWKDDVDQFNGLNYDQNSPALVGGLPSTWVSPTVTTPPLRPFPDGVYTKFIESGPNQGNKGGYADLAFYSWARDLRPDLNNNVATFLDDRSILSGLGTAPTILPANRLEIPQVYWNPKNDPATWQHVVQFVVAFGLTSGLDFPGDLDNLRKGTKVWSDWLNTTGENGDDSEKVDDTWHATLNSRGELLSANNPQEVVQQMNQVFQSIADRSASVSAVSVSSSLLTTATLSFQTFFNGSSWSGTVQGKKRLPNGAVDEVVWDAACLLDGGQCASIPSNPTFSVRAPSSRVILTNNGSGVNFDWASLSSIQKAALNKDFDNNQVVDTRGPDRLNFIRGDRTLEGSIFRTRVSTFGAVVNSNALVVAGTNDIYWRDNQDALRPKQFNGASGPELKGSTTVDDGNFLAHVRAIKNRSPTVYVGANDGMLHALDAGNGAEKWAYVPNAVYKNLARLTSKSNLFTQSYVDSTPVVREVYTGGRWRTLLVGALRFGGQGVYALDITDPSPSVLPNTRVAWEFSDANDADLGLTYGRPIIARVRGRWAVLVPGGYNADDLSEGLNATAGSERAVLYVLDASNGSLIRKFSATDFPGSSTSSIGLSSLVGGDYVFEEPISSGPLQVLTPGLARTTDAKSITQDQVLDVAFAGDNEGNLWRFNFENDLPSSWTVKKFYSGDGNPITAQPRIATAEGYAIVSFGSGRFVAEADRTVTTKQNLYGIYDPGPNYGSTIMKSQLVAQTITTTPAAGRILVSTTDNPVNAPANFGWFAELPGIGERSIVAATYLITPPRLIFPTFTPNGDPSAANDPCRNSALSTLYVLNPANGGPARSEGFAAFDVNGDGVINASDSTTVSGFQVPDFVAGATAVNQAGGGEFSVLGIGTQEAASLYPAGSVNSGLCGGADQPACVCDGPGLPACTCGPPPPSGRAACGPCVKNVTDPRSQRQCPGGGLSQPLWRRTNSRDLPAWDPNERN